MGIKHLYLKWQRENIKNLNEKGYSVLLSGNYPKRVLQDKTELKTISVLSGISAQEENETISYRIISY